MPVSNSYPVGDASSDISKSWIDQVAFNTDGLIPAIAQDKETGEILMMAWMNKQALQRTVENKTAVYFSRSRQQLWHKGETSGHTQHIHDIFLDCDADALVLTVTQIGGIACHTGRKSCFYQQLDLTGDHPTWETTAPVLKDPDDIYGIDTPSANTLKNNSKDKDTTDSQQDTLNASLALQRNDNNDAHNRTYDNANAVTVLSQLDEILHARKEAEADTSYVASLYAKGLNKILEKVGEEAVEAILAAKDLSAANKAAYSVTHSDNATAQATNVDSNIMPAVLVNDLVYEIADVWFHTVVTLAWFDIKSDRILAELARRFGLSGIDEKNSRSAK